ncbi:MAG TPA: hypothetical protein VG755_33245 [Nannocystaceae bacterium]|nr:hypothetical protein [Nannocystaceae bacterium]
MVRRGLLVAIAVLTACGDDAVGGAETLGDSTAHGGSTGSTSSTSTTTSSDGSGVPDSTSTSGGPVIYDVAPGGTDDTGAPIDQCKVGDDIDAVGDCEDQAPPDSFEPAVQWAWAGDGELTQAVVTPLVANLTDDNGDGAIDLCDIPDVVVTGYAGPGNIVWAGKIAVLDGASGSLHYVIDEEVSAMVNPALGDLDGDAVPEIVTARAIDGDGDVMLGRLVAYRHDGTPLWVGDADIEIGQHAVALADLDADGDVEIMLGGNVADHTGHHLWDVYVAAGIQITTAADLDGDDDLEVILGLWAFHHDGTPYYSVPDGGQMGGMGHPQVADLDDDGEPEVLVVGYDGLTLVEHDGTVTYEGDLPNLVNWRPAAIHDTDGDGAPELMVGAANSYSVLEADLGTKWTQSVLDMTGFAAGTAFDFLGDASAEAMYADETTLFVFDGDGQPLLTTPRTSWTQAENPVVADVDDDGSAEIVVVSNLGYDQGDAPMVQVIRDVQDRWIQARRIWNQHAYHVTNVREDGTVPAVQPKNWQSLNTFRTQAQIAAGGGVCRPAG